jgi:hypothetical protein
MGGRGRTKRGGFGIGYKVLPLELDGAAQQPLQGEQHVVFASRQRQLKGAPGLCEVGCKARVPVRVKPARQLNDSKQRYLLHVLAKAAAIGRRQAPNFFVLQEHDKCAVLLGVAGVERLRIRKPERVKLRDER